MKNTNVKESTASYLELASQTYGLYIERLADVNQRGLAYWKSVWDVVSKPYAASAVDAIAKENFERANQVVALTVGELQTHGTKTADFAEKLFAHNAKVQDTLAQGFRGLISTGISNVNFVKEAATQQFDDIAKRLDEVQARTTATVSSN